MSRADFIPRVACVLSAIAAPGTWTGAVYRVGAHLYFDTGTVVQQLDPDPNGQIPSAQIVASEALAAGNTVNVWSSAGAFRVRQSNASASGRETHGYVLASVASGATATVYFGGLNNQLSGLTPGPQFMQTTAGAVSASPATGSVGSGVVVQQVGIAVSATAMLFQPQLPLYL